MKRKLYDSLMQWKTEENGRTALLMENIVAQMLAASGHKLYFYYNASRDDASSRMKIDFLIAKSKTSNRHNISPIEVKSSKNYTIATVYKGNIIKNLIMDCQSYTKYRPNETTGGIFVSWRRKEELPTGA